MIWSICTYGLISLPPRRCPSCFRKGSCLASLSPRLASSSPQDWIRRREHASRRKKRRVGSEEGRSNACNPQRCMQPIALSAGPICPPEIIRDYLHKDMGGAGRYVDNADYECHAASWDGPAAPHTVGGRGSIGIVGLLRVAAATLRGGGGEGSADLVFERPIPNDPIYPAHLSTRDYLQLACNHHQLVDGNALF